MASYRKRNGKWNAQVRRTGLKAISKTFILKSDAIKWATGVEVQLEKEVYIDYTLATKTRLSEVLKRYDEEVVPMLNTSLNLA